MPEAATTHRHENDERRVNCPVNGCDETPLARGVNLHVLRSAGGGHGPQGEVPAHISFDDLETVGTGRVAMDYPEERNNEQVARLCPYCEQPFRGKHGVMIHLGQVAGRKNHPEDAPKQHEPDDFAIVQLDDQENIVEVVEDAPAMPSTVKRRQSSIGRTPSVHDVDPEQVENLVGYLRDKGLDEEADRAEQMLAN